MDFSIIVAARNAEDTLSRCINSILKSAFLVPNVTLEILLINDGSTDNTSRIFNSFFGKVTENIVFKEFLSEKRGPGHARNIGLNHALGRYILFCDADDVLLPRSLKILWKEIGLAPEANIIWGNYSTIDYKGKHLREVRTFRRRNIYTCRLTRGVDVNAFKVLWNKVYQRSWLVKNKILFSALKTGEDALFNMEVISNNCILLVIPNKIYCYTKGSPTSTTHADDNYVNIIKREKKLLESIRMYTEQSQFNVNSFFDQEIVLFGYMLTKKRVMRINKRLLKINNKEFIAVLRYTKVTKIRYFTKKWIAFFVLKYSRY
ncbi:glycosyltransferase family 2 protein [Levilactobacillus brevis]|uniref:glycosyltransferase family 2 protein n=1 Tax=Levilactobacillus brevis TaxID=1580 RepID=UPI000B3EA679|nr:glycosyltransferase family 2 protein [Levilactobacillus brevis]ARW22630.1 Dolichyl-phosphate beta-glucosyltransferase [Levilactobacillus brevis]